MLGKDTVDNFLHQKVPFEDNQGQIVRARQMPAKAGWEIFRRLGRCSGRELLHRRPYPHAGQCTAASFQIAVTRTTAAPMATTPPPNAMARALRGGCRRTC